MADSNDNPNIGIDVLKAYRNFLLYQIEKMEYKLQCQRDYLDYLYERYNYVKQLVRNGITHDEDGHRVNESDVSYYNNKTYSEYINLQFAEEKFELDRDEIQGDIAIINEAIRDEN